jgi:fatty-acyl-CoA synthase
MLHLVDRKLLDIAEELLAELHRPPRGERATLDASLDRDLGLGSLERVELLLRLEQAFGLLLPDAVMERADTLRDLATALRAAGEPIPEAVVAKPALPPPHAGVPPSARTLADVLVWHADLHPTRVHIILWRDDGRERPITYGELSDRGHAVAAGLQARGLRRGDPVAIMLRTEEDFFAAFFGILFAGGVPVPVYPPFRLDRIDEYAVRQVAILNNAAVRFLVTFPGAEPVGTLLAARVPSLEATTTVPRLTSTTAAPTPAHLSPDGPALIQYTSGSTADPKGVLLSHTNALANIRAIAECIALRPDDVAVSWLPLYHDMGLIGSWLAALHFGIPIVILSPLAFLHRPARWLRAIHAHRGTLSAAPNFAFELCARKVTDEEIRGLDLSSWRAAFNGSEPVSVETIERFTRRFAFFGFRPEALCPVYGLAEVSAALTVPPLTRGPRVDLVDRPTFERSREARPAGPAEPRPLGFVSCGRPLPEHEVRIVDAHGLPVRERVEGRIQFRGPSVTVGYVRNPRATTDAFCEGWMDSGDLGYCSDGELFITGRRKDLIIKGGRNIYPQEIEEVVGDTPGIRKGCVAAFGVADPATGTERLVVVAESREGQPQERARLQAAAVERVLAAVGIPPDVVVIAKPSAVLKTPSGKVRRSATREAYLRGQLGRRRPVATQWAWLVATAAGLRMARMALSLAFTGYIGLVLLLTLPPLWARVLLLPPGAPVNRLVRRWCRMVLSLAGCPVRVEGLENLRGARPAVLATNHASYLDAVVLSAALPIEFRIVVKRELATVPLIGTVIRKAGHLTVERVNPSRSAADAERVAAALGADTSLLFFPEGTFQRPPGLLPFKLGAFKSAVQARCPVIPIALRGTRDMLPAHARCLRPARLTVAIGPPIRPAGEGWREMVRLRDAARDDIARRLGERPTPA